MSSQKELKSIFFRNPFQVEREPINQKTGEVNPKKIEIFEQYRKNIKMGSVLHLQRDKRRNNIHEKN